MAKAEKETRVTNIDWDKLEQLIEKKGRNLRDLSLKMKKGETYLSVIKSKGRGIPDLQWRQLQMILGFKGEDMLLPEPEPAPKAEPEPVSDREKTQIRKKTQETAEATVQETASAVPPQSVIMNTEKLESLLSHILTTSAHNGAAMITSIDAVKEAVVEAIHTEFEAFRTELASMHEMMEEIATRPEPTITVLQQSSANDGEESGEEPDSEKDPSDDPEEQEEPVQLSILSEEEQLKEELRRQEERERSARRNVLAPLLEELTQETGSVLEEVYYKEASKHGIKRKQACEEMKVMGYVSKGVGTGRDKRYRIYRDDEDVLEC